MGIFDRLIGKKNKKDENDNRSKTDKPSGKTEINAQNITQIPQKDDKEFISWILSSIRTMSPAVENPGIAAKKSDFALLEIYGRVLKEESRKYLEEIKTFNVSTRSKTTLDEYRNALENLQSAGEYTETGAKNVNMDNIMIAASYMIKGQSHMNVAAVYVKDIE